jgi:hypothetical protein
LRIPRGGIPISSHARGASVFAREANGERRAFADRAFDLDRAAEKVGEALHDIQTEADTAVEPRLRAVDLVEFFIDQRPGFRRNADAGVRDLEFDRRTVACDGGRNLDAAALGEIIESENMVRSRYLEPWSK